MIGRNLSVAIGVFGLGRGLGLYAFRSVVRRIRSLRWRSWSLARGDGRPPLHVRIATSDWGVLSQVYAHREYDIGEGAHGDALLRRHAAILAAGRVPIIVDCGANIGLSSLWYAETFPGSRVFAIEPEPANFAMLSKNAASNAAIVPIHAAVSDHVTRITLHNVGDAPWAWQTREDAGDGSVPTVTIPDVLAREPNGELLVVKVDIEGGELDLMRSNTDWVDAAPLVVFEDHDWMLPWKGTAHAFLSVLTRRPRAYLRRGENTFAFSHDLLAPTSSTPEG